MQIYANPNRQDHLDNVAAFRGFMSRFQELKFFLPSPDKAPWHVQCKIDALDGSIIVLNFWPHSAKAQRDGMPSVEGWSEVEKMVMDALSDSGAEDFDLIEG